MTTCLHHQRRKLPAVARARASACATARAAALCGALAALPAAAVTLYDPGLASLPTAQGWQALTAGAAATQGLAGGAYTLDTTGAGVALWGNSRLSPLLLDTDAGFVLSFSLQMLSESHSSANRAGYSVVLVGNDPGKSLELAFWADHVWAQSYDAAQADRFVHGQDAAWDSTSAPHHYSLLVQHQQFSLSSDGTALLSGALVDYSAAGLPYSLPNFVFFGDNSSRGSATSALGLVTVTAVPEPAAGGLLAAGLAGLAGLAWRRARLQRA